MKRQVCTVIFNDGRQIKSLNITRALDNVLAYITVMFLHTRYSGLIADKIKKIIIDFTNSNHSEILIISKKTDNKYGHMLLVAKEDSSFFNIGLITSDSIDNLDKGLSSKISEYLLNLQDSNIHKQILDLTKYKLKSL